RSGVRRLRLSARRDVRVRGRSPYVADVRRPHTKYAIGTAPSELINDTAAAHFAFEPRTSFDGRRARSIKAAILSAPSIALVTTVSRRVRGSRSSHFLRPFIRQIVCGDDPGGRFEREKGGVERIPAGAADSASHARGPWSDPRCAHSTR